VAEEQDFEYLPTARSQAQLAVRAEPIRGGQIVPLALPVIVLAKSDIGLMSLVGHIVIL
jgi:hypothetical protein